MLLGMHVIVLLIALALPLAATAFWIWMIVDCATREEKDKLVWLLIILFTHVLGALIYFFVRRRVRLQVQGY